MFRRTDLLWMDVELVIQRIKSLDLIIKSNTNTSLPFFRTKLVIKGIVYFLNLCL